MCRIWLAALALTLAAYPDTLAERAFEALRDAPPLAPSSFEFVVIADTRDTEPIVQPDVFKQSIAEFNVLKPAFVVDVGDLILGGSAEGLDPQWAEFERVVGTCDAPFFPVGGNHDISDKATEKIWLDRVGPLYYAFSYGNSRFIMLNTDEVDALDRIGDAQAAWLKNDLESNPAENIFLFMHKPYFASDWEKNWGNIARIIADYPVRVVFGSHWHLYRDLGEIEGARYVITGGGGAEIKTPEDEGGFFHYLYVKVRGNDVSWAVIKPGNILPPEIVTAARIEEMQKARTEYVRTEPLEVPYGANFDRVVEVLVTNPSATAFDSLMEWSVPEGWTVEPTSVPYTAAAQSVTAVPFTVRAASPQAVRFPVPQYITQYKAVEHGGPVPVERRIDLVPVATALRADGPVMLDGRLDEWQHAVVIPHIYGYDYDVTDANDLAANTRVMWDRHNLYLAVEVEDDEFYQPYAGDIVWSADGIQLFIGDRWEWGLTLTQAGPEVFLYKGVDRSQETVNTAVQLAVAREGRRTVYEAAFPISELTPLQLKPGETVALSVVANDLDPSVPERPRHWAEITPGAGIGAAGFPKIQVVLGPDSPGQQANTKN